MIEPARAASAPADLPSKKSSLAGFAGSAAQTLSRPAGCGVRYANLRFTQPRS